MTQKSITGRGKLNKSSQQIIFNLSLIFYLFRSVLMLQIIRRLAQDDNPLQSVSENHDQSLDHQLTKLWNKILNHGWSDHSTTVGIDRLFKIGGATWLVTSLVKVLYIKQTQQLCVHDKK